LHIFASNHRHSIMTILKSIIADHWKMDGGVAFGVVPKVLWNRNGMADEQNMIPIVTRCLLVIQGERRILVDAGMGNKREERYYQVRYRDKEVSLVNSLKDEGIEAEDITDVFFTHLHDDHVGGATVKNESGNIVHVFPNAQYHCSLSQWEWARNPNKREAASYFPDNLDPLLDEGRLHLIREAEELIPGFSYRMYNGHTIGQLIPFIDYQGHRVVFSGDFIPTAFNIPMAYVPSVDIQPLVSMEEKGQFLAEAAEHNYILLFEHDSFHECCTVKRTEKLITTDKVFTLAEIKQAER